MKYKDLLKNKEKVKKSEEILEIPKKIKKNRKIKLFYIIRDLNNKRRKYAHSADYRLLKQEIVNIVIYGISALSIFYLFTKKIDFYLLLFGGIGLWIFEKKILGFIKELLASFKPLEINK